MEMAKLEVQSCAGVKAVAWAPDGLKLATGGVGELGCFSLDHGMWSSQKFETTLGPRLMQFYEQGTESIKKQTSLNFEDCAEEISRLFQCNSLNTLLI